MALAVLYGLTSRPVFSCIKVLLIVLVSNSTYESLREPFVCAEDRDMGCRYEQSTESLR